MEDVDCNPKEGDTLEMMKKELKKMKVAENREEPFKEKKGITTNFLEKDTYYIQNTDDNRSRRDNWKPTRYVRSDSRPGFLRTASKNNYMRDNSKFRRGSDIRSGSLPGSKFTGPRNYIKNGVRNQSKLQDRQKSELFKKVETLEKDMKGMREMLKGKQNIQFVEEEVIVDV